MAITAQPNAAALRRSEPRRAPRHTRAPRLRPPLRPVWDHDPVPLVTLDPVTNNVAAGAASRQGPAPVFHFDRVFDQGAGQGDVYDAVVSPLVGRFLAGYNATIMAYGQTGSGKTHTIGREGARASARRPHVCT